MEAPTIAQSEGVASIESADGGVRTADSLEALPKEAVSPDGTTPRALEVGARMRCVGLVSCAEMNGTYCTLQSFNPETGRWTAQLEKDNSCRHFKPVNLEHPDAADLEVAADKDDAPVEATNVSTEASAAVEKNAKETADKKDVAVAQVEKSENPSAADDMAVDEQSTAEKTAVEENATVDAIDKVTSEKHAAEEKPAEETEVVKETTVVESSDTTEPLSVDTSEAIQTTTTVSEKPTTEFSTAMETSADASEATKTTAKDSLKPAVEASTAMETSVAMETSADVNTGSTSPVVPKGEATAPTSPQVAVAPTSPKLATAPTSPKLAAAPTSPRLAATVVVRDEEDLIDDIVPMVSYEGERKFFSKDGRYILPKREEFPSIFCGLRVTMRIEALPGSAGRSPMDLLGSDIEQMLCDDMAFAGTVAHWEDVRGSGVSSDNGSDIGVGEGRPREIIAALSAMLPDGRDLNSVMEVNSLGVKTTIVSITETCDDVDPERITALADIFREVGDTADAIALELPLVWIIKDKDFKSKSASIGLYPGSFWMGFFKSWGKIEQAEIFFRTVSRESEETMIHLVVQFAQRASLKMCFTFLHNRYLAHPKLENGVRPPWCHLINFQDFKGKACGSSKLGARKSVAKAIVATNPVTKAAAAKPSIAKAAKSSPKAKAARMLAPAAPGTAAEAAASAAVAAAGGVKARARKTSLAPMTPLPKAAGVESPRLPAKGPVGSAPTTPAPALSFDGQLPSPAEVMEGLSGRQLEVFKMVMSRMERLEKENQELMQILLQMQGLLHQQQQRNKKLTQVAGLVSSGSTDQEALQQVSVGVAGLLATPPQNLRQPQPLGPAPTVQAPAPHLVAPMPQKRRADNAENRDTSPGPDGEAAPWKAQRRRQKRQKGNSVTPAVAGPSPNGVPPAMLSPPSVAPLVAAPPQSTSPTKGNESGLAAHYNALLGV
mmetsp:Transcript_45177/g.72130  ORF Transcript_45177/g.72130 Transcript_45177/m.72130 type:complete len:949 (+) Transcript_45177:133-2979(+)